MPRDLFLNASRPAQLREKDTVLARAMRGVVIADPAKFHAMLMPSLYGPEMRALRSMGVPPSNLFAVERDKRVHAAIRDRSDDFAGMRTTAWPEPIERAVDRVPFDCLSFVYWDFFGQPGEPHLTAMLKLLRLRLLARPAVFLLTSSIHRGEAFSSKLNRRLILPAGEAYLRAACSAAQHEPPTSVRAHPYRSGPLRYVLLEARWA